VNFDTEELCDSLRKLSLLLCFYPLTRHIKLHDFVRQYLIHEQRDDLPALHNHLLNAYRSSLPKQPQSPFTDWAELPAKEQYLWRNIAYHLVGARRKDELRNLLFNFVWLQAKLEATDVNSLISDFDFLEPDRTLRLIQSTIRLSSHILAQDKTQLGTQVFGRLMEQKIPLIKNLLDQIKRWKDCIRIMMHHWQFSIYTY
jgi:hypothetical protein